MNALAPLLRGVFAWNHNWVMRNGGTGIAELLGCRLLASTDSDLSLHGSDTRAAERFATLVPSLWHSHV